MSRYTEHRCIETGPLLVADSTMESGERKVWLGAGGMEGRWVTHAEFRGIVAQLVAFAEALPPLGGTPDAVPYMRNYPWQTGAADGESPDTPSPHLSRNMNGDILLIVDGDTQSIVATFGSPLWYAIVGSTVPGGADADREFTEATIAGCAETQRRLDALEERRKAAAEKFGLNADGAQPPDYSELLQRIREAAGDSAGKLMQDELVARIAALSAGVQAVHQQLSDAMNEYQERMDRLTGERNLLVKALSRAIRAAGDAAAQLSALALAGDTTHAVRDAALARKLLGDLQGVANMALSFRAAREAAPTAGVLARCTTCGETLPAHHPNCCPGIEGGHHG